MEQATEAINITTFRKERTAIGYVTFTVGKVDTFYSLFNIVKIRVCCADEAELWGNLIADIRTCAGSIFSFFGSCFTDTAYQIG